MSQFPVFRVADLAQNSATDFDIVPSDAELKSIAQELGLLGLGKMRFKGSIQSHGKRDWKLSATLGATVTQPCVVTLDPVKTRIDTPVERVFVANYETPETEEAEMPEDDSIEALGSEIVLADVMIESLSLNVPVYPRKAGAELGESVFTKPGQKAMTDEDTRPFAGLAALKDQLSEDK